MKDKLKGVLIAMAAVAVLAVGGAAIADRCEAATTTPPTRRSPARRWSARARRRSTHTGGGKVTGTEAGDEEGAYEVEVTRADGSQVDVHLDSRFNVIGAKDDSEQDGRTP